MAEESVLHRLAWPIAVGSAAATVLIGVATTYATTGGPRWWWWVLVGAGLVLAGCIGWGYRLQSASTDQPVSIDLID
jgi:hypothetical protein